MCLTSDAVYRIRDADAIFRIERKDDQKIAQKSKLFYRKYFEFTSNLPEVSVAPSGESFRNTFFFLRMVQSFYRRYLQNTTNNVTGAQEHHDRSRYAAYSAVCVSCWPTTTTTGWKERNYFFNHYAYGISQHLPSKKATVI